MNFCFLMVRLKNKRERTNAMNYDHTLTGIFLKRPNRFIAHVLIENKENGGQDEVVCHVKNTGRCRELLIPGVTVLLQFHPEGLKTGRKTAYSLIGVYKMQEEHPLLINMDSQAPNKAASQWLLSMAENPILPFHEKQGQPSIVKKQLRNIRREVTYGNSRFDLAFDYVLFPENSEDPMVRPAFLEVKGVTLEENKTAMFPDAPTKRGVKHLLELADAHKAGFEAYVLFVIQMKEMKSFSPNKKTHPEFGDALKKAEETGVHVLAYDCIVTQSSMNLDAPVPVVLT